MKSNEDEDVIKFNPPLYLQRYKLVSDILENTCPPLESVADLGCAEGRFLRHLKRVMNIRHVCCVDIDATSLEQCRHEARPLTWDCLFGRQQELQIDVYCGSVTEADSRLIGVEAVTCIELIEHLRSDILSKTVENIFGFIEPKLVIITTPNSDFNVLFPQLKGNFRHWDHKFEWTRKQFTDWCESVVNNYPKYNYKITGVGVAPLESQHVGFCTQVAIFQKDLNNNFDDDSRANKKLLNNYKIVDSFNYNKSDRIKVVDEPLIDWDSVLLDNKIN